MSIAFEVDSLVGGETESDELIDMANEQRRYPEEIDHGNDSEEANPGRAGQELVGEPERAHCFVQEQIICVAIILIVYIKKMNK